MIDINKLRESHEQYVISNKHRKPNNKYYNKSYPLNTKKRKTYENHKQFYVNNRFNNFTPNNTNYSTQYYPQHQWNPLILNQINPYHFIQQQNDIQMNNSIYHNHPSIISQDVNNNSKIENLNSSTITVSNIPDNLNKIENINNHFRNYGKIINIEISLDKMQAHIKYADRVSALNAINSKDPVFGNRFIEIDWYKEEAKDSKPQHKLIKIQGNTIPSNKSSYVSEEYKKLISERKKTQKEEKKSLKLKLKVYEGLINKVNKELNKPDLDENRKAFLIRQKDELYQKIKTIQIQIANINSKYPKDLLLKRYEELKQRLKVELKRRNLEENNSLLDSKSLKLDKRPKKFIIHDILNEIDENDIKKHFEVLFR